jgi:nicastrin
VPVGISDQQLPPSSLHSLLRLGLQLGGVLIGDHETSYKNNYYHSVFDTPASINVIYPENITEKEAYNYSTNLARNLKQSVLALGQTVYSISVPGKTISINEEQLLLTINKLIYCFYKNANCSFFNSILTSSQRTSYQSMLTSTLPKGMLSFYTSVNDAAISGKWISQLLLRYFTRDRFIESFSSNDCSKDSEKLKQYMREKNISLKHVHFTIGGICLASGVYSVSSVSPAFVNYLDGYLSDTEKFSAWSESSWSSKETQMRMFMFPSSSLKTITITLGIVVFILSIIITYVMNKYSNRWFGMNSQDQVTSFLPQIEIS